MGMHSHTIGITPPQPDGGMRSSVAALAAVAFALAACALHGALTTRGIVATPDQDAMRDMGFAQALLDGNWFGDPSYAGAIRYYPPLLPILAAAAAALSGARDLAAFWVAIGPWVNLAAPLAFFLMARRLLGGAGAGAVACLVFVFWNGAASTSWLSGGYSPWFYGPGIAQILFFLAMLLIHARAAAGRLRDAALVGAAIGLTFLAHIIPAVILTVVATVAAGVAQGVRIRTVLWLAVVAATQLAVMAPYLLPLLTTAEGVVNAAPAGFVAPALRLNSDAVAYLLLLNLPAAIAAALLWRLRGVPGSMDRLGMAMLLSWTGVCLAALARHYACEAVRTPEGTVPAACSVFVLTIHHYHFYLQVAGACAIAYAAALLARRRGAREASPRGLRMPAAAALVCAAAAGLLLVRPSDRGLRAAALDHPEGSAMDLAAYRWMMANTSRRDLFVTFLNEGGSPARHAVMTVLASGRETAALPLLFSNPYVRWEERDALRRRFLAAVEDESVPMPCAPDGRSVWLLLPVGAHVGSARASTAFSSQLHTISKVSAPPCGD